MNKVRATFPEITLARDSYDAIHGADAVILATEWEQFRNLDWERIHKEMARPASD